MEYPSQLLTNAVDEFAKLPGVGRKTALRLVLHLLRQEPERAIQLGESLIRLRNEVHYCKVCHNISDSEVCSICSNPQRDPSILCVVENVKEVMVVEATRQFGGLYHVLGGLISPMDGVGPQQLQIESLVERIRESRQPGALMPIQEVILALSTTMGAIRRTSTSSANWQSSRTFGLRLWRAPGRKAINTPASRKRLIFVSTFSMIIFFFSFIIYPLLRLT